jgi:hypothetical protein
MIAEKQSYNDILLKIKDREPLPLWYKNLYTTGTVAGIALLYLSSVLFMAWWSYDVFEKTRLCKFEVCGVDSYIFGPGYEYAITAIALGFLVYFLYRTTDWPYVKERMLIVLTLILVGAGVSVGAVTWLKTAHDPVSDSLYDVKETIKANFPWRYGAHNMSSHLLKPIIGVVEESTADVLIISMPLKQKISLFYEQSYPKNLKPMSGSRVVVQIQLMNNALYVQSIEEL